MALVLTEKGCETQARPVYAENNTVVKQFLNGVAYDDHSTTVVILKCTSTLALANSLDAVSYRPSTNSYNAYLRVICLVKKNNVSN